MMTRLISAVFVIFVLTRSGGSVTWRTWKHNTNFNNTENWEKRELPCKTSSVIFPVDLQLPILLPSTKSVMELRKLILSRDGMLIFPQTEGILSFSSEESHASCSGGDFRFTRTGSKRWVDSNNWMSPSSYNSTATPDLERIPCRGDAIEFPDESTFSISLPSRPIAVSKVKIQGQEIKTQSEWSSFLDTFGYEFFPGLLDRGVDFFTITGETCDDECECNNAHLYEDVCSEVPSGETNCANPITPLGFCHPICGASFLFKDGSVREIRSVAEEFLQSSEYISHTSKINGFVQIVIVNKEEYSGSVQDVAQYLLNHLNQRGLLRGPPSKMNHSGLRIDKIKTKTVVERFFLGLLVSLIGFGTVFCVYDKNWASRILNWQILRTNWRRASSETWGFASFENTSGVVAIREDNRPLGSEDLKKSEEKKTGFDNPMFSGSQLPSESVFLEFAGRRVSCSSVETDSGSLAVSDSPSPDQISLKDVALDSY